MATHTATQTLEIIQNNNLSKYSKTTKSTKDEGNESSFTKILLDIKESDKNSELLSKLTKLKDTESEDSKQLNKTEDTKSNFINLQNSEIKDSKLLNKLTKLQDTKVKDSKLLNKLIKLQNTEIKDTESINKFTKIKDSDNTKSSDSYKLSSKKINILTENIKDSNIKNRPTDNIDIKNRDIEKVLLNNKDLQNEKINLPINKSQSNSKTVLKNEKFLSINNIINNKANLSTNNIKIDIENNEEIEEIDINEIDLSSNDETNDDNRDEKIYTDKNSIKETPISNIKLSTLLNENFKNSEIKIEKPNLKNIEKELKQQNYVSYKFLSKTENLVKNEHEIKQAKTLNEIIKTAKRHNLNPQKIEIETKKQEKPTPKLNPQSQTSINSAKAILNSHPHISKLTAALNLEIDENRKNIKNIDKKRFTSLQELLQKNNTDKTDNVIQTSATKSSNTEQEISLTKIFNQLHSNSPKPNQKENISTSITSKLKENEQKNITNSGAEKTLTKVDLNEMIHNDNINKSSEQISQRIIDAKQTIRHFAQTLQEQVENYKPPFTRMQLSLDPKDLGKVEVTLISRGNNLHIQVNSNPTAIGVMAVQGNELRNQLTSMGFTDVQMQFNMGQQQQQQQQQNNRRQMYSANKYIDIDEIPENYESLEIIIPQYV